RRSTSVGRRSSLPVSAQLQSIGAQPLACDAQLRSALALTLYGPILIKMVGNRLCPVSFVIWVVLSQSCAGMRHWLFLYGNLNHMAQANMSFAFCSCCFSVIEMNAFVW